MIKPKHSNFSFLERRQIDFLNYLAIFFLLKVKIIIFVCDNEHIRDLISQNEDSHFLDHCKEKYVRTPMEFKMDVIETFKTLRQRRLKDFISIILSSLY